MENKEISPDTTDTLQQACCSKQSIPSTEGNQRNIFNIVINYAKRLHIGDLFNYNQSYPADATKEIPGTSSSVNTKEKIINEIVLNTDTCIPEEFATYREKLKNSYETYTAHMSSLFWDDERKDFPLKEYYVDVKVQETDNLGNRKPEILDINQIFSQIFKKRRNILVTGNPGCGKSTLCKKIAYDWANDSTNYLSHFDFVVIVILRTLHGRKVSDVVLDTICKNSKEKEEIKNFNLLVILDGFDEIHHKNLVIEFIRDDSIEITHQMTILVTSRPHVEEEIRKDVNCRYAIRDFSEKQQNEYIKKLFRSDEKNMEILLQSLRWDYFFKIIGKCPIMLHMLCCLQRNETLKNIKRKTDLYLEIFRLIIKRYQKKYESKKQACGPQIIGTNCKEEEEEEEEKKYENYPTLQRKRYLYGEDILIKLGKLLCEKVLTQTDYRIFDKHFTDATECVQFCRITEDNLKQKFTTEERQFILGIEILIQEYDKKDVMYFEVIHKTFEEFLIALYCSSEYQISLPDFLVKFFTSATYFGVYNNLTLFYYGLCEKFESTEDCRRWYEDVVLPVEYFFNIYQEMVDEEEKKRMSSRTKCYFNVLSQIDYFLISVFKQLYFIMDSYSRYEDIIETFKTIDVKYESDQLKVFIFLHLQELSSEDDIETSNQIEPAIQVMDNFLNANEYKKLKIKFCGILYFPFSIYFFDDASRFFSADDMKCFKDAVKSPILLFSKYKNKTYSNVMQYHAETTKDNETAETSREVDHKVMELYADLVALEFRNFDFNRNFRYILINEIWFNTLRRHIKWNFHV